MPHCQASVMWIRWSGGPAALPPSLTALLLRCSENLCVTFGEAAPRRNISEASVNSNICRFFFPPFFLVPLPCCSGLSRGSLSFSRGCAQRAAEALLSCTDTHLTQDVKLTSLRCGRGKLTVVYELERGKKSPLNQ